MFTLHGIKEIENGEVHDLYSCSDSPAALLYFLIVFKLFFILYFYFPIIITKSVYISKDIPSKCFPIITEWSPMIFNKLILSQHILCCLS